MRSHRLLMSFLRCLSAGSRTITGIGASVLGALVVALEVTPAVAQSLPACPPPVNQEYLLLVRGETEADRNQIAAVLPDDSTVLVCRYLDETLVRAGGFDSLETVNAWATYMTTVEGFESFVSRPSQIAARQPNRQTANLPPANRVSSSVVGALAYQPQRLAPGYAVLVDYGSRPEIAEMVEQVVRPVGLAVYQQRAYLLADYTSDAATAADTLQRLSDAQMAAILVDAQQVVQLAPEVARF